jgi:hypothetical protein
MTENGARASNIPANFDIASLAVRTGTGENATRGTDVTGWFTGIPAGLAAQVVEILTDGTGTSAPRTGIVVEFDGTPTAMTENGARANMVVAVPATFNNGAGHTVTNEAGGFRIINVVLSTDPNAGNVIIWGDGANLDVGLDLTREVIVRQNPSSGAIGNGPAIQSYTNNRGRWTAVRTDRQAFVGGDRPVLPTLLQRGFTNLSVSTNLVITDRNAAQAAGVNRGEPVLANRITFTGVVRARPRFGDGARFTVNYSPIANHGEVNHEDCDDDDCEGCAAPTLEYNNADPDNNLWTLTERGKENAPMNEDFMSNVQVYLVDNANRKAREANRWRMFDALEEERFSATLPGRILRGFGSDGKVTRDQIVVRTIAREVKDDDGNIVAYIPASREQGYRISGLGKPMFAAGKEPAPRPNAPLVLNLRKGFEIVGNLIEGVEDNEPNGQFQADGRMGGTWFTMTDKGITFLRPQTSSAQPALTANATNSLVVRLAPTAKRPASANNTIQIGLPAVTAAPTESTDD